MFRRGLKEYQPVYWKVPEWGVGPPVNVKMFQQVFLGFHDPNLSKVYRLVHLQGSPTVRVPPVSSSTEKGV